MKQAAAVIVAFVALLLPTAGSAAAWDVGPPVGSKVPALHAVDLKGAPVSVRELAGKNGLVLVFFRSAKWCPYCQRQLMDLRNAPGPLGQRATSSPRSATIRQRC
jgi:thiol-disulfide isomerase/thioredoxin